MTFGSLFAGAGGFDMGFHAAGMTCLWQVEIDRTARSVLAYRFPGVRLLSDVRECGKGRKHRLAKVDVVVGGFPCQDVSVAGKREGFGGQRSSLFHELVRVTAELRPRFLVWENVPGLLSSYRPAGPPPDAVEGGEWEVEEDSDFETVLSELGRIGYFGAWRLLDAVHAGVPQSRPRLFGVFAPGRAGAARACQVLAFPESLRGGSQAGGQEKPDVAGCLGGGTPGRGWSDDLDRAGAFVPIAGVVTGRSGINGGDETADHLVVSPAVTPGARRASGNRGGEILVAFGGNDTRGGRRVAAAPSAKGGTGRIDFETETFVVTPLRASGHCGSNGLGVGQPDAPALSLDTDGSLAVCVTGQTTHALTSEGADASEDGTGRGTPIVFQCHGSNVGPMGTLRSGNGNEAGGVPFVFNPQAGGMQTTLGFNDEATGSLGTSQVPAVAYVFDSKQSGEGSDSAAPTLRAMGHDGSHANAGGQLAVCLPIDMRQASRGGTMTNNRPEGSSGGAPGTGIGEDGDPAPCIAGSHTPAVGIATGVRRLTPVECERLMNWPDDWTRWRADGTEIKDGPRYRMCGNGVVKSIAKWIGERLMEFA